MQSDECRIFCVWDDGGKRDDLWDDWIFLPIVAHVLGVRRTGGFFFLQGILPRAARLAYPVLVSIFTRSLSGFYNFGYTAEYYKSSVQRVNEHVV